jgi:RimJ/RimL family protein N-acetyltransferase
MVSLRLVQQGDCRLLWEWVNEPAVRASAFSTRPISWEEHVAWFAHRQKAPDCQMHLVLDDAQQPVGQVRFDLRADGSAEIDVSIAPTRRRQGYGTQAVRLACARLFETRRVSRVVARVRAENMASIRMFERAGFVHEGPQQVKGLETARLVFSHPAEVAGAAAP